MAEVLLAEKAILKMLLPIISPLGFLVLASVNVLLIGYAGKIHTDALQHSSRIHWFLS